MHKVYLSHSLQESNIGYGNFGTELDRMRDIAIYAKKRLKAAGVEARLPSIGWSNYAANKLLWTVVNDSNTWGSELHIGIHSNAGPPTAMGTMTMYYPGSTKGKRLAEIIQRRVSLISPGNDRGLVTKPIFYETREVKAPVAYLEAGFHTSPVESKSLVTRAEEYGNAIADSCLEYLGIPIPKTVDKEPKPIKKKRSLPTLLYQQLRDWILRKRR